MSWWRKFAILNCQRFNLVAAGPPNLHKFYCSSVLAAEKVKEIVTSDLSTMNIVSHNSEDMKKFLYERFSQEKNCYTYALNLVSHSSMYCSREREVSANVPFQVMNMLAEWLQENEANESLTLDIQRKALQTALYKKNVTFIQLVCHIFGIRENCILVKEIIRKFIAEKKIPYAANCIIALGLQNEFSFEEIALPLLMQKKIPTCIRYFEQHPVLLKQFVALVDDHIGKLNKSSEFETKENKHNLYAFHKYISILVNQRVIPHALCPNTMKLRSIGAINTLLHKRNEKTVTDGAWEKMMVPLVRDDVALQKQLIRKLMLTDDRDMALKMAEMFNLSLDIDSLTGAQSEEQALVEEIIVGAEADIGSNDEVEYLSLDLDSSKIKFVTNVEDFFQCVERISQFGNIVGIDSEWKPTYRRLKNVRLSLMQLAVNDSVYILDMLALHDCLLKEHWDFFMKEFFANPHVLKLGCGVTQDIQMILYNDMGSEKKMVKFSHVVDIAILYQKMDFMYLDVAENPDSNLKGLSKLCHIVLGKPLNKGGRFCNWEERPLTDERIAYAALDAHCLLKIFDSMKSHAKAWGGSFDEILEFALYTTVSMTRTAVRCKQNFRWFRTDKSFLYRFTKPVSDFKVVVDSKIADLGLKLRMYGADVVIRDIPDICANSFKVIEEESRVVVGSSAMSEKVKGLLSDEKYCIVQNPRNDKDNAAFIFQHFNIQMSSQAIFSRCMQCNNSQFHTVMSDPLRRLWETESPSVSVKRLVENSPAPITSETSDCTSTEQEVPLDGTVSVQLSNLTSDDFAHVRTFKVCIKCGHVQFQR